MTDVEDFNALLPLAESKGVVLKRHDPQSGVYYTMRDKVNGALIGTFDRLVMLDEALTNWVDEPRTKSDQGSVR